MGELSVQIVIASYRTHGKFDPTTYVRDDVFFKPRELYMVNFFFRMQSKRRKTFLPDNRLQKNHRKNETEAVIRKMSAAFPDVGIERIELFADMAHLCEPTEGVGVDANAKYRTITEIMVAASRLQSRNVAASVTQFGCIVWRGSANYYFYWKHQRINVRSILIEFFDNLDRAHRSCKYVKCCGSAGCINPLHLVVVTQKQHGAYKRTKTKLFDALCTRFRMNSSQAKQSALMVARLAAIRRISPKCMPNR
jgi:hypothetical protein